MEAMQTDAKILRKATKIIGIGLPRASIERNYALRAPVGEENFYSGISTAEQRHLELMVNILQKGGVYTQRHCVKLKIMTRCWFWGRI
ncbi:NADH-quinone oxidoreductase subunit G [Arsenophonus endosymbiont of Bemisia tabaci Q2]|nr:NADH-quinone oxidoreductase subunit G [Arsenophonus endosymbiont of Bemisia tabaci Q2]